MTVIKHFNEQYCPGLSKMSIATSHADVWLARKKSLEYPDWRTKQLF